MSIEEVRNRIEDIENSRIRDVAKFQLLTACRICEAVGKYAVQSTDLVKTNYKGTDLALFTLRTAKRDGEPRIIALPISQPWVSDMTKLFQSRKGDVFHYSEWTIWNYFKEEFHDLDYLIMKYNPEKGVSIPTHERGIRTHALRHLRLSELVNLYGFDEIDLATFAGWKMKGMASRYVTAAWGRYIDKLVAKA